MSENTLIDAVRAKAEKMRAIVVTRAYQLDGELHMPKMIKEQRRLTTVLNSERKFLAMTNVKVINLLTGKQEAELTPFLQVNVNSIEFVKPYPEEMEQENQRMSHREEQKLHARDVLGDVPPSF